MASTETRVSSEEQAQAQAEQRRRERNMLWAFWSALGIGLVSLFVFSAAMGSATPSWASMWKTFALGMLVAGAASLIGALLGFLFGLPRGADGGSPTVASVNSVGAAPGRGADTARSGH